MEIGNLSQNQIITTFGPGSIIDAKEDSVMGLDINYWNNDEEEYRRIYFNKLASYLGVRYFLEPKQGKNSFPVIIFPDYHVCSNVKCNLVFKLSESVTGNPEIYDSRGPRCPDCGFRSYPSRFIVFCENGHIDEFPYKEYLHGGDTQCEGKIRLRSASYTSSLNSLILSCDNERCKVKKTMGDALLKATFSDYTCKGKHGHRPSNQNEKCTADLIPSLRGATNVYFSIVRSALEIPPWSDKLFQIVEKMKVEIDNYIEDKKIEAEIDDEAFDYKKAEMRGLKVAYRKLDQNLISFERFIDIYKKVAEGASEYSEIKESEYNSILNHKSVAKNYSNFLASEEELPEFLKTYFTRLIRIEKVREIMALKGFTRASFPDPDNDNFTSVVNLAGKETGWLPAVRTSGEGIFIELNREEVDKWLLSFDSKAISNIYDNEYKKHVESKGWEYRQNRDLTYVLLHSLSHSLIRELSLRSGYSTTELQERIYYSENMCGLLIYTASGDSEGTLGGLEEMGKTSNFQDVLLTSLKNALVCSADPGCLKTYPGNENLNGAACHACLMIPETACENGNRLLDRRTIVPTQEKKITGYFEKLVKEVCGVNL
ncbi:DrmB family protein [Senegalia sp. (in: firmicutes)]|uniref:DrmB family protein n=1 Tax=Senegalia sp. (in: firmicutes) TaxID=1924098 RepID=UPI003F9AE1B9